jgi:hypothetical protein
MCRSCEVVLSPVLSSDFAEQGNTAYPLVVVERQ